MSLDQTYFPVETEPDVDTRQFDIAGLEDTSHTSAFLDGISESVASTYNGMNTIAQKVSDHFNNTKWLSPEEIKADYPELASVFPKGGSENIIKQRMEQRQGSLVRNYVLEGQTGKLTTPTNILSSIVGFATDPAVLVAGGISRAAIGGIGTLFDAGNGLVPNMLLGATTGALETSATLGAKTAEDYEYRKSIGTPMSSDEVKDNLILNATIGAAFGSLSGFGNESVKTALGIRKKFTNEGIRDAQFAADAQHKQGVNIAVDSILKKSAEDELKANPIPSDEIIDQISKPHIEKAQKEIKKIDDSIKSTSDELSEFLKDNKKDIPKSAIEKDTILKSLKTIGHEDLNAYVDSISDNYIKEKVNLIEQKAVHTPEDNQFLDNAYKRNIDTDKELLLKDKELSQLKLNKYKKELETGETKKSADNIKIAIEKEKANLDRINKHVSKIENNDFMKGKDYKKLEKYFKKINELKAQRAFHEGIASPEVLDGLRRLRDNTKGLTAEEFKNELDSIRGVKGDSSIDQSVRNQVEAISEQSPQEIKKELEATNDIIDNLKESMNEFEKNAYEDDLKIVRENNTVKEKLKNLLGCVMESSNG